MHHILRGIRHVRSRYGRRPAPRPWQHRDQLHALVTDAVAEALRENDRRLAAAAREGRR